MEKLKNLWSWLQEFCRRLFKAAGVIAACSIPIAVAAALFCWFFCMDFIDNYQMGYKFNAWTGEITVLDHPGYVITPPIIVKVHHVDLRPMQVSISANERVLNAKLIQFKNDKEGLLLFLRWHGRKDYENDGDHVGSFRDILKSYAYDGTGKRYPFLTILRDLNTSASEVDDLHNKEAVK